MIISTTHTVPGREIVEILDIVRGNTVRTRNIGVKFIAGFKNIIGGEVHQYTELMAHTREHALERMIADAERIGADAVVGVQFNTASIMAGDSEILAYGTAVRLSK